MYLDINALPRYVLGGLDAPHAILHCSEATGGVVKVTTSLNPKDLQSMPGAEVLDEVRRREGVFALTLTLLKVNADFAEQATADLENRFKILAELDALLRHVGDVYVAYAITHLNSKPLDDLTIAIGGDCYRKDQPSLAAILERTRDLAAAMIRKAVMIFPDISALHGGKKGEWIVVDRNGHKIEGLSEDAIFALGTLVLPMGVMFLDQYKEQRAVQRGVFDGFPSGNFIRPDTCSPDVLSGQYWKKMCEAWAKRGLDMSYFTCLPDTLGGPLSPSSRPTGYGIATTAIRLAEARFKGRQIKDLQFVLEALGGVGMSTVDALVKKFGVPPQNILAFDYKSDACQRALDKYHIADALTLSHEEFYAKMPSQSRFDVWINNGLGGNTTPEQVQKLLDSGVRLFCGAANNLLKVETKAESLQRIFDAGGWVWPDEAASGGGWTLAVMDVYQRCQGRRANDMQTEERILNTIISRNENLVGEVLGSIGKASPTGRDVWERITALIDERVARTLAYSIPAAEQAALADVTNWRL